MTAANLCREAVLITAQDIPGGWCLTTNLCESYQSAEGCKAYAFRHMTGLCIQEKSRFASFPDLFQRQFVAALNKFKISKLLQ